MAHFTERLTPELRKFIAKQPMFFTATAAAAGRINLSPKGIDTFRVVDDQTVGYADLTGSGNETSAHIQHDGRLTIMFCSFDAKPLILRLYGRGRIVRPGEPRDPSLAAFPSLAGERQLILLEIESVQTSCGWGVPQMDRVAQRQTLIEWAERKGDAAIDAYQRKNNQKSIDGLAVEVGRMA